MTRLIAPPSSSIPPPVPPPSPPPRAWGVWGWVGARALDASLWTLRSGRGHLACLHNGIISVPASATAAVSTSCPSASTSCPWRSSTNCPPSKRVLKRGGAAGRQSCCINVCGWLSWELHNVFAGSFVPRCEAVVLVLITGTEGIYMLALCTDPLSHSGCEGLSWTKTQKGKMF